jgi:hypothetical protein
MRQIYAEKFRDILETTMRYYVSRHRKGEA